MGDKNIVLAYVIAYLKQSWFWMGIWVFYYLRFTDYAGIGLIETVLIVTMTLGEIPTGAVADLLGKKKTLSIAFFLEAIGNFTMALAPSFQVILIAVFIGSIGGTLFSGAYEALVYDSLKENNRESIFDRVIANISSIKLVAIALAGLVSGLLYVINPRLPFALVGVFSLVSFFLTFFLREPAVDTEKFSFASFISQNKQGVSELYRLIKSSWIVPVILAVGSLWVLSDEMLESFLAVEFGFNERTIGPFFAVLFLLAAVASQLAPILRRRMGDVKSILLLVFGIVLTYLTSPFVGLIAGGLVLMLREALARNFQNITDVYIHKRTKSELRATVISAYNMFKNIPYVLSAFWLGSLMDRYSARTFSYYLGVVMIIVVVAYIFVLRVFNKRKLVLE